MIDNIPPMIGLPIAALLWGWLIWGFIREYRAARKEERGE